MYKCANVQTYRMYLSAEIVWVILDFNVHVVCVRH